MCFTWLLLIRTRTRMFITMWNFLYDQNDKLKYFLCIICICCVSSCFCTSFLTRQVTDSFNWLQSSLDTMVSRCINRIHDDGLLWLTAPPPPAAAPSNSTTVGTTVSATRQHPLTIGEKLLNSICPSGCSQKGHCLQRKCRCSTGYTGVDCSIKIHSAPQVSVDTKFNRVWFRLVNFLTEVMVGAHGRPHIGARRSLVPPPGKC